jgi:hypothetical protein
VTSQKTLDQNRCGLCLNSLDRNMPAKMVGGTKIILESKSQMPFMLPWRIQRADPGPPFETFDADVSRTLAACLPEDYLNGSRLLGWVPLHWPLPEEIVRCRLWELGRYYSRPQRLRWFLVRWFGRKKA